MNKKNIRRGEIYLANLEPIIGSEQGGIRPVLIIQNNKGNKHSGTTIAAPITFRYDNLCSFALTKQATFSLKKL